jgi:excinuclease ABC subunit B
MQRAIGTIRIELEERLAELEREGKLLEAQRLRMRTTFDLEMMEQFGFCSGIENYSRHIDGRALERHRTAFSTTFQTTTWS